MSIVADGRAPVMTESIIRSWTPSVEIKSEEIANNLDFERICRVCLLQTEDFFGLQTTVIYVQENSERQECSIWNVILELSDIRVCV